MENCASKSNQGLDRKQAITAQAHTKEIHISSSFPSAILHKMYIC